MEKRKITDEEIEQWFKENNTITNRLVTLVIGEDDTGKTGMVINHIVNNLKNNEKALILDLDGGAQNLRKFYNEEQNKNLIIKNPRMVYEDDEGNINIDYISTMNYIKKVVDYVNRKYKDQNIKYFVFDGLSTLLKYAERQMRLDKRLDLDSGVQMRFWLLRNKLFEDVLETIKALPINVFLIGHEDFLLTEDSSSIKIKVNAMVWQRIHTMKYNEDNGYKLIAHITKSKNNPLKQNKKYTFMKVENDNVVYNTIKIFSEL